LLLEIGIVGKKTLAVSEKSQLRLGRETTSSGHIYCFGDSCCYTKQPLGVCEMVEPKLDACLAHLSYSNY